MKKIIILGLFALAAISAQAGKRAVEVTYTQEEVYVVLDGMLVGMNPKAVKIDFELAKSLIFFKRGYYTQRVEIDPDVVMSKMKVDLIKKPKSAVIEVKTLIIPDTLKISSIVTNMDHAGIFEILKKTFVKNNYYIGNSVALFPGAKNEIENSKYKIAIEIVDSDQVRHVYKSPKFMMGYIKIRWALLNIESNEVEYFEETEGSYFVKIGSTKGLVISEKMKVVMEGAIKEAQFKLLTDSKFTSLLQEKE